MTGSLLRVCFAVKIQKIKINLVKLTFPHYFRDLTVPHDIYCGFNKLQNHTFPFFWNPIFVYSLFFDTLVCSQPFAVIYYLQKYRVHVSPE